MNSPELGGEFSMGEYVNFQTEAKTHTVQSSFPGHPNARFSGTDMGQVVGVRDLQDHLYQVVHKTN